VVCAMRTQSLCLRPYHMERGPVAGSRMRHKRTSGAAMRAWAHGLTIIRWNSPQFHAWNLSMIPRARVLIIRRSVPIMERSVQLCEEGGEEGH
jgi:hypothetical protein